MRRVHMAGPWILIISYIIEKGYPKLEFRPRTQNRRGWLKLVKKRKDVVNSWAEINIVHKREGHY